MKKIPSLYKRDPDTNLRYVKPEPHPDCEWAFKDEGFPTYKHDGTSVLIERDGPETIMWKRREIKKGKPTPKRFRPAGEPDQNTGKRVGWVLCDREDPADKWHFEAFDAERGLAPGTYELVGPKIQGNPHRHDSHLLILHGSGYVGPVPTGFDDLARFLHRQKHIDPGFEGIVWHHPDGRMAKIKAKDFPRKDTPPQ